MFSLYSKLQAKHYFVYRSLPGNNVQALIEDKYEMFSLLLSSELSQFKCGHQDSHAWFSPQTDDAQEAPTLLHITYELIWSRQSL